MSNRYMKICSYHLHQDIANQKSKEILPYCSEPGIDHKHNNHCFVEKGALINVHQCWWNCRLVQPFLENNMENKMNVPKKQRIELLYNPVFPLPASTQKPPNTILEGHVNCTTMHNGQSL